MVQLSVFLQKLYDQGLEQDTLKRAQVLEVPTRLLLGLIMAESNGDAKAMRYEDGYKWICEPAKFSKPLGITLETERQLQSFSYGLCQVMGATARDNGHTGHLTDLLDPNINLRVSIHFLKKLNIKYKNWPDTISAYNQGSPKKKLMSKKYKNQAYVDRVINNARYFGW
jgi:hypothetical protein